MKRQMALAVAGLVLMASVAWGQAGQGGQQGRRGGRGGPGDVAQAVTLTPEQTEKVKELTDKVRQEMRDAMGQRDPAAMEKMRQLRDEMLTAAKAGDDKKVEELQKQLNTEGTMAKRREMVAAYYGDVEKILTPEQKKPFAMWRKLQDSNVPASLLSDPDMLQANLKKVELSDVQKKHVDAAYAHYEKAVGAKPGDAEVKKAATLELATQVVATLKPSQKVLLADAAMPAGGRGPRGGEAAASQPAAK